MVEVRGAIRLALGSTILALLLTVSVAAAAAPAGPRLAVVKVTWKPERARLITVDPQGKDAVRLAGGQERGPLSLFGWGPMSWRPDGAEIAVTGLGDFLLAKANGGGARRINAAGAEWPVFAPDGRTIAFLREGRPGTTIWTIDLVTWEQRQLTPWRGGLEYVASSFSPDGRTLLATRFDGRGAAKAEPVALDLATGRATRLLPDGLQPVYSPDGSKIALFRKVGKRENNDLFVLDVEKGTARRLTRTQPGYELFASWDPSGERIAFARYRGRHFEWANSIFQINADGTCETEILSKRRTLFYGPAWQPGPGREAGRIRC
jgi:dipeptidyl aminopeptidase/acylaminoacyl peptidase